MGGEQLIRRWEDDVGSGDPEEENADVQQQPGGGRLAENRPTDDAQQALQQAAGDAKQFGAINSYVYSTNPEFIERAQNAFGDAGANLSVNMIGPMPLTYAAAFSDYHVSGLNPAGNATLTDASFVSGRFRIVESRKQIS